MQETLDQMEPAEIIPGAARGADQLAGEQAQQRGIPCRAFPAQWNRYGKSAGYRRNEQMLNEGNPDLVVAFPGEVGTTPMLRTAKQWGFTVKMIGR